MEVEIVSVTPIRRQATEMVTEFEVRLGSDEKEYFLSAKQVIDFQECRIAVAERTGCLLVKEGEWDDTLARAWQDPRPPEETERDREILDGL